MGAQITLYASKMCPYAHRAEMALLETGLPYKRYEINLRAKPEWYTQVSAGGQVPALTYGGPDVPPDQPSPESTKLIESMVLVEFANDLAPTHPLLPTDPLPRARARFFIEALSSRVTPQWYATVLRGEPFDKLFEGLEYLGSLVKGPYAVGEQYSIADVAATPVLARLEVCLRDGVGNFKEEAPGEGAYERLMREERFARWREYFAGLKERESFRKSFDEAAFKQAYALRVADFRKS
ncbi:thioredoxin-like protein [Schizophyllum commune]